MSVVVMQDLDSKMELIKSKICKGATDEELELFMLTCKRTGLDPFMRQIYSIPRYCGKEKRMVQSIQTSIDGFRLIAERTGRYSPGKEATFVYGDKNQIISATAYVKKMTADGTWHEVAASAYFSEYSQKDKEGRPTKFWQQMPHVMLAKCAESQALRKAFPAELSGLYTQDEMQQSSNEPTEADVHMVQQVQNRIEEIKEVVKQPTLTNEQIEELLDLIVQIDDPEFYGKFAPYYEVEKIEEIPQKRFGHAVNWLKAKINLRKEPVYESVTA